MRINSKFKSSRILFGSYVATFSLFLTYFLLTPYISIYRFKLALDNRDHIEAGKYINFPYLKKSIQTHVERSLLNSLNKDNTSGPIKNLAIILVRPVVSTIVDTTVTPLGLQLLLDQGKIIKQSDNNEYTKNDSNPEKQVANISLGYTGFNRFILESKVAVSPTPIRALWQRDGFFHWRLQSIEIPEEIIQITFP